LHTRDKLSQDFCADALVRGLVATGRLPEGQAIMRDYLGTYRRDRTPLLRELDETRRRIS
jgi:hypothetical protein